MAARIDVYSEQYKQVRQQIAAFLETREQADRSRITHNVRAKFGYENTTEEFVNKVLDKAVRDGSVVSWVEHGKALFQARTVADRLEAEHAANAPKTPELLDLLAQVQAKIEAGVSVNDAYLTRSKLNLILNYLD